MKERILKSQNLKYLQQCDFADAAAREALRALESECTYTLANSEALWGTAWSAAFNAYECDDPSHAESVWQATQAARRHAKAICDGCIRRKLLNAGKVMPAWLLAGVVDNLPDNQ